MRTRWRLWCGVVGAALLAGCQGCGAHACTLMGAESGVDIQYQEVLQHRAGSFTVTACVDGTCRTLNGVVAATGRTLFVKKPELHDASRVDVRVTVTDERGRKIFSGHTQVVPTKNQPNGPGCEPTAWSSRVVASGRHSLR